MGLEPTATFVLISLSSLLIYFGGPELQLGQDYDKFNLF